MYGPPAAYRGMHRRPGPRHVAVPLLVLLLLAGRSSATLCGDDVDGRDVPCACGDVVASDVVLDDDPVTTETCPGDGLVVRAPDAAAAVTIDLHGKTLHGSGHGTGLWLLIGGPGGARVVSSGGPATVVGFLDGIASQGEEAVAQIENVTVLGSARDGVHVDGVGYEVRDTTVRGSGRDGFSLDGRGFHLVETRAEDSHRFGYFLMGSNGTIGAAGAGAVAIRSGMTGFSVMGMGHQLVECAATDGAKDGVHLMGMHHQLRGCRVGGNAGSGITGMGMGWELSGNDARDNGGDGILVGGMMVVDEGGNAGSGNLGLGEPHPAIQCQIGGLPCRP